MSKNNNTIPSSQPEERVTRVKKQTLRAIEAEASMQLLLKEERN